MKKFFWSLLLTAFLCITNSAFAYNMKGISVFLDSMFDQPISTTYTKETYSKQTYEPFEVYKDRQAYVALFSSNGNSTDGLWHAFNKENGKWDIEVFSTQSQMIPGDYYLKFKTTGIYIGGTGITGFWTYDE